MELVLDNGRLLKIKTDRYDIPFRTDCGTGMYIDGEDVEMHPCSGGLIGEKNNVKFEISYKTDDEYVVITSKITNLSDCEVNVENLGLRTGIDCYMEAYPQWNDVFFPTLLRCEKTHLWGYFENTNNDILAVAVTEPTASYHIDYNMSGVFYGHRIYTVCIDFFCGGKLPERNPKNSVLEAKGEYEFNFNIIPTEKNKLRDRLSDICGIMSVKADKYTLELNEPIKFSVIGTEFYSYKLVSPSGNKLANGDPATEYGLYKLVVESSGGFVTEAAFYCRKPWSFYLKAARSESLKKPQKASTHCESWYGFFSAFLAAKHFPAKELDEQADALFNEILPLLFDCENGKPIVLPARIQNTAAMISLLADRYEVKKDIENLYLASKLADYLVNCQTDDGAYRCWGVHYTCVIYVAKSLMELVSAEIASGDEVLLQKAHKHYESVTDAVENLADRLENIDTEGEITLEDGMISCSALQLALYALGLPEEQRQKYTVAAEHMMNIHSCLEQREIPDARMNGGTLRFWESQFDVMIKSDFMNSPHGWSAWSVYAKYYLYLLTGREKYLREFMNAIGSCVQLMDLNGNLRWAFAAEPQIRAKGYVPDINKPVSDGYMSLKLTAPAYRGKFENMVFGEEYIPMISGWYRTGAQTVTGGYDICPLADENNKNIPDADRQGGCCDNDVHEIFKCMEECVLGKAFLHECESGEYLNYSCDMKNGVLNIHEASQLVYCIKNDIKVRIGDKERCLKSTNGKVKIIEI